MSIDGNLRLRLGRQLTVCWDSIKFEKIDPKVLNLLKNRRPTFIFANLGSQ